MTTDEKIEVINDFIHTPLFKAIYGEDAISNYTDDLRYIRQNLGTDKENEVLEFIEDILVELELNWKEWIKNDHFIIKIRIR